MINPNLIWLLLVPVVLGLCLWLALRKQEGTWIVGGAFAGIGMLVVLVVFFGFKAGATVDVEIWNGQITGKQRLHGTYEQPYSCNCTSHTSCSGSGSNRSCTTTQSCQTCYETHYTVHWNAKSTLGEYTIDSKDSTWRKVYQSPDPLRWLQINPGDPVAQRHTYTNYVQAVPESLFKPSSAQLKAKFANMVPPYPDTIFDFYRINRFFSPGLSVADSALWNNDIGMMLRELGPRKQVNAIVVIAKTDDPDYEYALRDGWEGVNKNDVVLLIGAKDYPKIDFVRVISWTKNELFKIELRDNVQALETVQREPIMALFQAQISKNFERRRMREFAYLESEIDPPVWAIVTLIVLLMIAAAGTYYVVGKNLGLFRSAPGRTNYQRRF